MCALGCLGAIRRWGIRFSLQDGLSQRDNLLSEIASRTFQLAEKHVEIGSILAQRVPLGRSQCLFDDVVLGEADDRVVEQQQFRMVKMVRRNGPRLGNSRVGHGSSPSRSG